MKNFLKFTVFIIFLPLLAAFIYYCVQYYTRDFSYYEQKVEQLEEENRLQKEKYEELIESYVLEISEYELTIKQMTESIDSLESQLQNSNNNFQIVTDKLKEYIAQVSSLQSNITTLEEQVEDLQSLNAEYSAQINELQQTIATLNQTIATLNDKITYYEELIASYNFDNKSVVTFKVNGKTHDVIVVENGQPFDFEVEDPTLLGYSFNGWSIDGINPITLQGYEFTEDTTLTALIVEENQVYYIECAGQSEYEEDHSITLELSFYASIDITGTDINSIRLYRFDTTTNPDSPSYVTNGSDVFGVVGLTDLKDYANIEDNELLIEIPTNIISSGSSLIHYYSDIYAKFQFGIVNKTFTFTDIFLTASDLNDVSNYVYCGSEVTISSLMNTELNLNKQYKVEFYPVSPSGISPTGKLTFTNGVGSFEWTSIPSDSNYSFTEECIVLVEKLPVGVYRMSLYLNLNNVDAIAFVHGSNFYFDDETLEYIPCIDSGNNTGSFVIKSVTEIA